VNFSENIFKTRGVIGRWKTPWTNDTTNQALVASASDAETPAQSLRFSLQGMAPAGAEIHSTSGVFTWTPLATQTPSTNVFPVRVTDDGEPPLSAERAFTVRVAPPPRLAPIVKGESGRVRLSWEALSGKSYRVEFKNQLDDALWLPLSADFTARGSVISIEDDLGGLSQRFYRLLILD
jgi:hypothetical protein